MGLKDKLNQVLGAVYDELLEGGKQELTNQAVDKVAVSRNQSTDQVRNELNNHDGDTYLEVKAAKSDILEEDRQKRNQRLNR